MPSRVALLFAYDGACFDGYARQPEASLHTVEGALMRALVDAGAAADLDALAWRTGSRTDRGVSARENVVVFDSETPATRVPRAVGGRVDGLWPLAAAEVSPEFDPRRAVAREYRYFLSGRWTRGERRKLEAAWSLFVGHHDLSAFARKQEGRNPMRHIEAVGVEEGADGLVLWVRGRAFLWQQVRRMVAATRAVVAGTLTAEDVQAALAGQGKVEVAPAPAGPLVLWRTEYRDVRFTQAVDAWARLEEKRLAARSAAWARHELYRHLSDSA